MRPAMSCGRSAVVQHFSYIFRKTLTPLYNLLTSGRSNSFFLVLPQNHKPKCTDCHFSVWNIVGFGQRSTGKAGQLESPVESGHVILQVPSAPVLRPCAAVGIWRRSRPSDLANIAAPLRCCCGTGHLLPRAQVDAVAAAPAAGRKACRLGQHLPQDVGRDERVDGLLHQSAAREALRHDGGRRRLPRDQVREGRRSGRGRRAGQKGRRHGWPVRAARARAAAC